MVPGEVFLFETLYGFDQALRIADDMPMALEFVTKLYAGGPDHLLPLDRRPTREAVAFVLCIEVFAVDRAEQLQNVSPENLHEAMARIAEITNPEMEPDRQEWRYLIVVTVDGTHAVLRRKRGEVDVTWEHGEKFSGNVVMHMLALVHAVKARCLV